MLTELVPLLAVIFSIGLPLSIPIVMISLNYRNRRRLMELHHAERMSAIERGMEVPPLPIELLESRNKKKRRSALLPGLVWFFIGLAVLIGAIESDEMPVAFGLVPLGIGLAYLIYYAVEGRHIEARLLESELRETRERNGGYSQGPATL